MRSTSFLSPTHPLSQLWTLSSFLLSASSALEFNQISPPPLSLSNLGKVGLAGDFDAISIYSYEGQGRSSGSNGSESVMQQLANGAFATLVDSDASIEAMCHFERRDGTSMGVVVGGNFTSLGGVEANGVAIVNPDTGSVEPLSGLTGRVNALLCDKESETLYVGGDFSGENSSNALSWLPTTGWANLPFEGFNKPVRSIIRSASGSIIFGGLFDGLGNITAPTTQHTQTINLQTANITTEQTTQLGGFNDPRSIICNDGTNDGPGRTWLLADGQVGSWTANFGFGFRPTKLRLRNTHFQGRGVKEFRFTAFPINGIMNLTFVDPVDNSTKFCESRCPLSDDPDVLFQDFEFVNVIGMNSFRIDISQFYGAGAGLVGIEVFQDDVFTYAVNEFNEPSCSPSPFASTSEVAGPWDISVQSDATESQYLIGNTEANAQISVTFRPDVQQAGNYSVLVFSPGCIQDNSCANRGRVTISGTYTRDATEPVIVEFFQTNNFDKYDTVYEGFVDAAEDGFRPEVVLTAGADQGPVIIVAQKVRFDLISNSTRGLNGLYEWVPGTEDVSDFDDSVITSSTEDLNTGAGVYDLVTDGSLIYVGGNFTADDNSGLNYIYSINEQGAVALPSDGLNDVVWTVLSSEGIVYVGGEFTNTFTPTSGDLSNIAALQDNRWQALGAGVNGRVTDLVPMTLRISDEELLVIAVSGDFTEINASGDRPVAAADGFAIWVPARNEWLARLDVAVISLDGTISDTLTLSSGLRLFSGAISSHDLAAAGAVTINYEDQIRLEPLPLKFVSPTANATNQKRALAVEDIEGVVTGTFYQEEDKDLTVLVGRFSLQAQGDEIINNLAVIDHKNGNAITGLNSEVSGAIITVHINKGILYAGGSMEDPASDVGGVVSWDLKNGRMTETQFPPLVGGDATVHAIATQPESDRVYVGGSFEEAGSFPCPALCVYNLPDQQWTRPGVDISGTISNMVWADVDKLILFGDMVINDTTTYIAIYDAKNTKLVAFSEDITTIPGPITTMALDSTTGESLFIAGESTTGVPYLMKWTGKEWKTLGAQFAEGTTIRGLQVLQIRQDFSEGGTVQKNHNLLLTGSLNIPDFGLASGALWNGAALTPFILTSKSNGEPGSLGSLFSQRRQTFNPVGGRMAKGFVILIALAIALGLVFLIVVLGVTASYIRRRREGYVPAPTAMSLEKSANIQDRVPPAFLFGSVGSENRL